MTATPGESLSQFVTRVMKEKHLSLYDVELLSGHRITAAYVSGIMNGTAGNPSIEKFNALADGLGVCRMDLFRIVQGAKLDCPLPQVIDAAYALMILRLMEQVVRNPTLAETINLMVKLPADELDAITKSIQRRHTR